MGEIAAAVSAAAAVAGVLLVVFGVGSPAPTKSRPTSPVSSSSPPAEAAPPAATTPGSGTPTPSAPPPSATSSPPTSPPAVPGTVLRTETFDLAQGYGFTIEDAPLRPGPGDIDETGSKYDVWSSSHQNLLAAHRDTRFVLLKEREKATYQTCRQQSAFETYVDDGDWDNASVCAYSPTGLIAGIETGPVDGPDYVVPMKVTIWAN
ncbi:hypothetical protein ACFZCG_17165 [Streptomyces tanashiensis]|uniref:hypothetical protein n=1 Tax=Streptomyces tanashiensis TaxID=67367 RepID=UPI0036F163BA